MYERLLALYLDERLTDAGLDNAVSKEWITEAQAVEIRTAKTNKTED